MVTTLFRSTLREIRQSMGRYLAILGIIGLGVGFFAGVRMAQPDMMATGVEFLSAQNFYDIRLLSTLGFTEDDIAFFYSTDGIESAHGAVYTEFLQLDEQDREIVLMAHSLTENLNTPQLIVGQLPESPNECLGDYNYFTEADLGKTIRVSPNNEEDTLDLFAYEEYTVVGLAQSPIYLNLERGTASIGGGSVTAFVLIPEDGFEIEAYYEIFLSLENTADPYSEAYEAQIDAIKPSLEQLAEERGDLRYTTLYEDALAEIQDGEQELADGWEEYRTERADAEQELADAYQELTDGEDSYTEGLADYKQGELDYADGLKKYEDGLAELADAEQELADGWAEYHDGKAEAEAELADAYQKLLDGEQEYADGLAELEQAKQELADAEQELEDGKVELANAEQELANVKKELDQARRQLISASRNLDQGYESYEQASSLHSAGQALVGAFNAQGVPVTTVDELLGAAAMDPALGEQLNGVLLSQGSSLEEFSAGWSAAEQALGAPLSDDSLAALQNQLDEGKNSLSYGSYQYREGLAQYNEAMAELDAAKQELANGEAELNDARLELEDGVVQLEEARTELDKGWSEYYDGKAEAETELADAYQKLLDGEAELADGKAELADAKAELDDARIELNDIPDELADARIELDDGWAEYYDGKAEADQEFADAEAELEDGEQEIADAYEELGKLKKADTYVLTRNENAGYSAFDNDTSIIKAISLAFPVFFFLVAALVCMTTMTRMVDEQRTQIGTFKALGYSNRQIMGKYLFYSGSAAALGSIIGYAIGSYSLPWIIWEIYGILYQFADLKFIFTPSLAIGSFAVAILCSIGATWFACRSELVQPAAELIRPKSPKAGKRVFLEYITPIWKRLTFLQKVSVRNVLRYRSRLIMMVIGIGGCTALLVTGFGLRDSVSSIVDDQFSQITLYDYSVTFREEPSQEEISQYLSDCGWAEDKALSVHSGSTDIVFNNVSKSIYLVISSTNSLDGFLSLHDAEGTPIPYPGLGEVVLNVGLAENMGIAVGDTIQLRDADRGTITATVSAICDHYVFNYVYLAPETYEQQLGQPPEFQTLYLMAQNGADPYAESVVLSDNEDISNVTVNEALRENVNSMLSRLDLIVVVVVVCAAALAFIVLYNLTNINITERIREIATIKVLGFYQNETASYVFREIRILSVVGSLFGLLLGKAMHLFVMAQVQVDGMYFPCKVAPVSYLISLVLTLVFATLITYFMRPKLRKVDMAESLKSIE